MRRLHQKPPAERYLSRAVAVRQKSKMANANEPTWQHMQEKAPQELVGTDGHRPFLVTPGVVLPPERDFAILEPDQPMVGDGDPMGIPGEVLQDMTGSSEWPFCIYDPVPPEELPQETME